jgi:hypothetical protein
MLIYVLCCSFHASINIDGGGGLYLKLSRLVFAIKEKITNLSHTGLLTTVRYNAVKKENNSYYTK